MAVLVLSACSGSSGGGTSNGGASSGGASSGSCGQPACGGNLVGIWEGSKVCIAGPQTMPVLGCSNASVTVQNPQVTRELQFTTGGTWTAVFTITGNAHLVVPPSCQPTQDQCTAMQSLLATNGDYSATCSFGTTCECDFSQIPTLQGSGTYKISGTTVTLWQSGVTTPYATEVYCVSGNTLQLTGKPYGSITRTTTFTQ